MPGADGRFRVTIETRSWGLIAGELWMLSSIGGRTNIDSAVTDIGVT